MNAFKNYTIAVLFISVIVLSGICIRTCKNNRDMDIRTGELATENDRLTSEIGEVTAESKRIAQELQRANSRLSEYEQEAGDIAVGLSEINSGISGVIESMREYVKKPD